MPGCPVHLSFDCVILLGFNEINGDGDGDVENGESATKTSLFSVSALVIINVKT